MLKLLKDMWIYNVHTSAGWGSEHDVVAAHQDAVGVQLRHARGDAQHAEEGG